LADAAWAGADAASAGRLMVVNDHKTD